MELYGYPGPQVPRHPKEVQHDHTLPWNAQKDRGASNNDTVAKETRSVVK